MTDAAGCAAKILFVGPVRAAEAMRQMASDVARHGPSARVAVDEADITRIRDIQSTEILVCLATRCGSAEMDAMPNLHAIVTPLIGFDGIDLEEATRRGIPVVNGDVAENRESMAEATIMLILTLLYRLEETIERSRLPGASGTPQRRMLKGRMIGIIGYGGITRELIDRLRPWGADLMVASRRHLGPVEGARFVELDDLLASSDVVVVLTNLDQANHHLLNRERLAALKAGALLVNTSRGGLIDENALIDALRSGQVGAAALDVFETEPLPEEHPLRSCPNVILTPHAVGHTAEMVAAIPAATVANVVSLLGGRLPDSCKNPGVANHWKRRVAALTGSVSGSL